MRGWTCSPAALSGPRSDIRKVHEGEDCQPGAGGIVEKMLFDLDLEEKTLRKEGGEGKAARKIQTEDAWEESFIRIPHNAGRRERSGSADKDLGGSTDPPAPPTHTPQVTS